MHSSDNGSQNFPRRWFGTRSKWALAVIAVVVALFLFVPRRVVDVVAIDSLHRWTHSDAPPQRSIVWQPAERIAPPTDSAEVRDSLIRPQLDEHGTVLYFTLRKADGHADLFRTRLVNRQWQHAEAVTELNSPADDIGPVISHDGQSLYLYSNREGGIGGFDIYVAQRTKTGWTNPVNLGPSVNSPAHEYDPAIAPDGLRLVFSSNRSPRMQRLITENDGSLPEENWRTTLRADLGLAKFDLYVSSRDDRKVDWPLASPLDELNTESNEGSPYIAASGAFLYFVSDRPTSSASETNFDIYRARLRGSVVGEVENLGSGVNSAANELEPALSEEGFRLYFSRSRTDSANAELYDLYASDASEIEQESRWAASPAQMMLAGLYQFVRHNVWWLHLAMLVIALILALVWFGRRISFRRASVPSFLLIAIVLHLLLGAGTFLVYFKDEIVAKIKHNFDEVVIATEVNILDSKTPEAQEKPEFDQVADIAPPGLPETASVPRQAVQAPVLSARDASNVSPIVARIAPEDAPTKVTAQTPAVDSTRPPELQRRSMSADSLAQSAVLAAMSTPQAVTEQQPLANPVDVERADVTPLSPALPPTLPRRTMAAELTRAESSVQRVDAGIDPAPMAETASPLTKNQAVNPATSEAIAAAALAELATADPGPTVNRTEISIPRETTTPTAPVPTLTPERSSPRAVAQPLEGDLAIVQSDLPAASAPFAPLTRLTPQSNDSPLSAELIAAAPTIASPQPAGDTFPTGPQIALARQTNTNSRLPRAPMAPATTDLSPGPPQAETLTHLQESALRPDTKELAIALPIRKMVDSTSGSAAPEQVTLANLTPTNSLAPVSSDSLPNQDVSLARTNSPTIEIPQPNIALEGIAPLDAPILEQQPIDRENNSVRLPTDPETPATIARARLGVTETAISPSAVSLAESPSPANSPDQTMAGGIDVDLSRIDVPATERQAPTNALTGSPISNARVEPGGLARQEIKESTQLFASASPALRRTTRGDHLAFAEGNIRLQTLLQLRKADDNTKRNLLQKFGAQKETLVAIERGLTWIELHQHDDGHWSLNKFGECCAKHGGNPCPGHGGVNSDTAATGLALLPFLGDGHTHRTGKHQAAVAKGLQWLVAHQHRDGNPKKDGDLFTGNKGDNAYMYSHGIATIALCEAYAMSGDDALRDPAQRAINFIVQSQHRESGGWRYQPNQAADTSVVGWQVMALKSGQMANLHVPEESLELARKWLTSVAGKDQQAGRFGYQKGAYTPTMTAEALLCREYLGAQREDDDLQAGQRYLLTHLPRQGQESSYYWYYGTQFMFHMQGDAWRQWNGAINPLLLQSQVKDGNLVGTWKPSDQWENSGGTIYATALRLLMLEVYYRHLPLYRALDE